MGYVIIFQDWMVKYDQDIPVQPRYDLNAPDLYIPCMGYVTYVLLAGFMLGKNLLQKIIKLKYLITLLC